MLHTWRLPKCTKNRPCLVVGTASPCPAKWLLAYYGTGRLVVDIKISRTAAADIEEWIFPGVIINFGVTQVKFKSVCRRMAEISDKAKSFIE